MQQADAELQFVEQQLNMQLVALLASEFRPIRSFSTEQRLFPGKGALKGVLPSKEQVRSRFWRRLSANK